jgi:hypothetical protein
MEHEEQERERPALGDYRLDDRDLQPGRPLHVVEDEQPARVAGEEAERGDDRLLDAQPVEVIDASRLWWPRRGCERRQQRRQHPGVVAEPARHLGGTEPGETALERLQQRSVRKRDPVIRPAVQDRHPRRVCARGELSSEAGLPQPRLAGDADRQRTGGAREVQLGGQPLDQRRTADERALTVHEQQRPRRRRAGAPGAHATFVNAVILGQDVEEQSLGFPRGHRSQLLGQQSPASMVGRQGSAPVARGDERAHQEAVGVLAQGRRVDQRPRGVLGPRGVSDSEGGLALDAPQPDPDLGHLRPQGLDPVAPVPR